MSAEVWHPLWTASYLRVIGDRAALGWILTTPSHPGGELLTTRGCFKIPIRDRGRFIASTSVTSEVPRG